MYEIKKILERYLLVNLFGPSWPSFYKKRICRAAVSQRLRNTAIGYYELSHRPGLVNMEPSKKVFAAHGHLYNFSRTI
jgi:hypothetical protein